MNGAQSLFQAIVAFTIITSLLFLFLNNEMFAKGLLEC